VIGTKIGTGAHRDSFTKKIRDFLRDCFLGRDIQAKKSIQLFKKIKGGLHIERICLARRNLPVNFGDPFVNRSQCIRDIQIVF
jgi:hypothetical protein